MISFVNLRALCGLTLLTCLCVQATVAPAQITRKPTQKEMPPSAFKLIAIKVTGTQRYKPEDVIATTGLQFGKTVSEDDFKQAVRILGDTGAFSDLQYSFQYSPEGTKLTLQVRDAEHFVPTRFDNVVWFSDRELLDQIHTTVPLFHGELPITGDLADQVSNALQAMLIARKLQGKADYLREAHEEGPVEAFVFTVTGPQIHIRNITFAGAAATELPQLEAVASKLQGSDYLQSILRVQEEKNFLPVYLQHGYLKASFGDVLTKVVQDNPQETLVDVTFPVDPGRQYSLADIQFSGNQAFPVDTLRPLIHLPLHQPANAVQLATDIDAVTRLYGTRGYMAASIQPKADTDDANSTVKYTLLISESSIYAMGDLELRGLDSRTTARLQDEWKLHDGDPYDNSYAQRFLEQAYKEISHMDDWTASVRESINQKEKTVDVTVRFNPKPR
jgi:outer membrane protein assembly factor BamA